MNEQAKRFFEENPEEPYWYYTKSIRVPNPKYSRRPNYHPTPWPEEVHVHAHL